MNLPIRRSLGTVPGPRCRFPGDAATTPLPEIRQINRLQVRAVREDLASTDVLRLEHIDSGWPECAEHDLVKPLQQCNVGAAEAQHAIDRPPHLFGGYPPRTLPRSGLMILHDQEVYELAVVTRTQEA